MGQYWMLVNLDQILIGTLPNGSLKLGENFWGFSICRHRDLDQELIFLLLRNKRVPDDYLGIDKLKMELPDAREVFSIRFVFSLEPSGYK